jgi:hypothetical protein
MSEMGLPVAQAQDAPKWGCCPVAQIFLGFAIFLGLILLVHITEYWMGIELAGHNRAPPLPAAVVCRRKPPPSIGAKPCRRRPRAF